MSSDFRRIFSQAAGIPENSSDEVMAQALADMIGGRQASKPKTFTDAVTLIQAHQSISYSEAASLASRDYPDLYFNHVEQARLN